MLPVVKAAVDVLNFVVGLFKNRTSEAVARMASIVFMDLQYLFVYLFITGVTQAFHNFFIVFVWVYMALIVHALFGLTFLCLSCAARKLCMFIAVMSLDVSLLLLFVWATIVGAKDGGGAGLHYMLVPVLVLYVAFHVLVSVEVVFKGGCMDRLDFLLC